MLRTFVLLVSCGAASAVAANDIFLNPTLADVPVLIARFEDFQTRYGASKAIVMVGKPAVPRLIEALRSDKVELQIWSAYTLGKIGPPAAAAAGPLAGILQAEDASLRAVAARSLGLVGTDDGLAVAGLAKATKDAAARVRQCSVVSLGKIGPAATAAVPQLIDALDDQTVRRDAIRSLVLVGKSAIPALTEALASDSVRLEAAECIRQIDPATAGQLAIDRPTPADLPALRTALLQVDKNIEARIRAARSLGSLDLAAVPILIAAFADDRAEVVQAAAAAFGEIGSSATPLLQATCKHESAQVRAAAVAALAAIGPTAQDALPELIAALTDPDRDVRHQAVMTLGAFGPAAEPGVPALIAVMQNPRDLEETRQLAVKTLAGMAPPADERIMAALRESIQDTNFGVSSLAKQMLKELEAKLSRPPSCGDELGGIE